MQRFSHVSEVPLALAVFLASDDYDYNDDPRTISATTLLKPLRQIILPSRVPQANSLVPLADQMKNRMGAAIHNAIELAWKTNYAKSMQSLGYPQRVIDRIVVNPTDQMLQANPDLIPVYLEQRLSRKLGEWTVTGKFDFIGEGRVQDFKSTTVWTYMNQVNNEKYTLQKSIYRWLDPKKITDPKGDIHFIFTDWQRGMAKRDPRYPTRSFLRQTFDLMPLDETERFIRNKLNLILTHMDADEADMPECDADELWRSEPVFKYYRDPNKTSGRSTKNFEAKQDAMLHFVNDGSKGIVIEKPGEVKACKFCAAFPVCTQKDRLIAAGDLNMES